MNRLVEEKTISESGRLALMGNPFTLLYSFRPCTQGHKVAFDDVLGIRLVEPHWQGAWKVVGIEDVFSAGHDAAGFVDADCLGKRGRVG